MLFTRRRMATHTDVFLSISLQSPRPVNGVTDITACDPHVHRVTSNALIRGKSRSNSRFTIS
jgi:hypothetical protein